VSIWPTVQVYDANGMPPPDGQFVDNIAASYFVYLVNFLILLCVIETLVVSPLQALVRHVQSKGYPNERFELVTNFPRRKLAHLDYDITLQDAGLCPQETVFVQERN